MRHDTRQTDRRQFIAMGAGAAAAAALGWRQTAIAADVPKNPQPGAPKPEDVKLPAGGKMPMRKLGKTGVEVSLLGLGGFHIGLPKDEKTAIQIVRTAVDHGVNFMDNCWDYNDGKSQVWMGHALRDGYRKRVFLMTKIDGRTRKSAAEQIDQCLRAFDTDVIDLVQIHEVIRMSDPTACSVPTAPSKRWSRRARPARSASSASRGTRARRSTSRCWPPPTRTGSRSTPCRCR